MPTLAVKAFDFKLDTKKVKINLSGSIPFDIADHLTWMFKSVVLKNVVKIMNKELPPEMEQEFNGLVMATQAMIDVYGDIDLDLAFTANPDISDTQMALYFNSTFFNEKIGYSAPNTKITDLTVDKSTKGNIQARVSKYTADSFMKVLYESGKLAYNISQATIPSSLPFVLNTDFVEGLMPGLVAKYGSGKPMTINLLVKEAPSVIFNEN